MRSPRFVGLLALATGLSLFPTPSSSHAAQLCACKRTTSGRVNRLTAVPPGLAPTCTGTKVLVCWNDDQTPAASGARAYFSAAFTPLAPPVKVPFDAESYDRLGEFTSGTFTATNAGYYLVSVALTGEDSVCDTYLFEVRRNGVISATFKYTPQTTPDDNHQVTGTDVLQLNAADQIEVWFDSPSCSTGTIIGGSSGSDSFVSIARLP
jgi:hypothetical protein